MTKTVKAVKAAKTVKAVQEVKNEIVLKTETIANIATVNEIVPVLETIQAEQEIVSDSETMSKLYELFLKENDCEYSKFETLPSLHLYTVYGLKKTLYIKIDSELNISQVATILNGREQEVKNCRNILTLKSLKATKSYTKAQIK